MPKITPAEKAAIYYALLTGDDDRRTLITIARGPESIAKLSEKSSRVIPSNWWRSADMVKKREQIERDLQAEREKIRAEAVREYIKKTGRDQAGADSESAEEAGKRFASGEINFLNPDEFLRYANEQANKITDDKERRNWLEMIAKLMNYKEKDDQESSETKKFYIMKTCETCEIYQNCKNCEFAKCPKVTI